MILAELAEVHVDRVPHVVLLGQVPPAPGGLVEDHPYEHVGQGPVPADVVAARQLAPVVFPVDRDGHGDHDGLLADPPQDPGVLVAHERPRDAQVGAQLEAVEQARDDRMDVSGGDGQGRLALGVKTVPQRQHLVADHVGDRPQRRPVAVAGDHGHDENAAGLELRVLGRLRHVRVHPAGLNGHHAQRTQQLGRTRQRSARDAGDHQRRPERAKPQRAGGRCTRAGRGTQTRKVNLLGAQERRRQLHGRAGGPRRAAPSGLLAFGGLVARHGAGHRQHLRDRLQAAQRLLRAPPAVSDRADHLELPVLGVLHVDRRAAHPGDDHRLFEVLPAQPGQDQVLVRAPARKHRHDLGVEPHHLRAGQHRQAVSLHSPAQAAVVHVAVGLRDELLCRGEARVGGLRRGAAGRRTDTRGHKARGGEGPEKGQTRSRHGSLLTGKKPENMLRRAIEQRKEESPACGLRPSRAVAYPGHRVRR